TLSVGGTVVTRQRRSRVTAESRTVQHVLRSLRLVHDLTQLMIVPTVGVIVSDDNGGAVPVRLSLQGVDHLRDERLLVKRSGVAGVTVLISRSFQIADGRVVAGVHG